LSNSSSRAEARIRDFDPADSLAILELNEANQPEVGPMDAAKLEWFAREAPFFRVVEHRGAVCGFLIGLTESESGYTSPNYQWFADRHERFAYVDRVALAEASRGQGLGPELYREFQSWALCAGQPVLCAEVNTVPVNLRSLRFHDIFGFAEVGRCQPYGSDEEVAMLVKSLKAI
jgi:predicted GNAT superfamily acetyltransferase